MRFFWLSLLAVMALSGCVSKGSKLPDLMGDGCDPFFNQKTACMPSASGKTKSYVR